MTCLHWLGAFVLIAGCVTEPEPPSGGKCGCAIGPVCGVPIQPGGCGYCGCREGTGFVINGQSYQCTAHGCLEPVRSTADSDQDAGQ
jgi:hypothetical protein